MEQLTPFVILAIFSSALTLLISHIARVSYAPPLITTVTPAAAPAAPPLPPPLPPPPLPPPVAQAAATVLSHQGTSGDGGGLTLTLTLVLLVLGYAWLASVAFPVPPTGVAEAIPGALTATGEDKTKVGGKKPDTPQGPKGSNVKDNKGESGSSQGQSGNVWQSGGKGGHSGGVAGKNKHKEHKERQEEYTDEAPDAEADTEPEEVEPSVWKGKGKFKESSRRDSFDASEGEQPSSVPTKIWKDKKGKEKEYRGRQSTPASSSQSTPQESRSSSLSVSFDEPVRVGQQQPPAPVKHDEPVRVSQPQPPAPVKHYYIPPTPPEVEPPEIYVDMVSEPPLAQPERFQSAAAAVVASSSLAGAYPGLVPSIPSPVASASPTGSVSGSGAGPSQPAAEKSEETAVKIVSEEILRNATEELIRQYPEMAKYGAESVRHALDELVAEKEREFGLPISSETTSSVSAPSSPPPKPIDPLQRALDNMRAYAQRTAHEVKHVAQDAMEDVAAFPRSILKKQVRFGNEGEGVSFITPPFSPPLSVSPPPPPPQESSDPFQRIIDLAKRLNK